MVVCEQVALSLSLCQVLVGLHDVHDEMVQATLRALADLVELVGGETVMGTPRSNIFVDATPRVRGLEERMRDDLIRVCTERILYTRLLGVESVCIRQCFELSVPSVQEYCYGQDQHSDSPCSSHFPPLPFPLLPSPLLSFLLLPSPPLSFLPRPLTRRVAEAES